MLPLRIGDVHICIYKNDDPNEPNEFKPRPAIVVSFTELTAIVVPVTTQDRTAIESMVFVKAYSKNGRLMGLDYDSYVNKNEKRFIRRKEIREKIGTCPFIKDILDTP